MRARSRTGRHGSGRRSTSRQGRRPQDDGQKEPQKKSDKPRFYGSSPVQHLGRSPGGRRTTRRPARRRSSSPPVALVVAIPIAILVVLGAMLMLASDDAPPHRASKRQTPAAAPATVTPAATASPEPVRPPSQPFVNDGMRDSEGEETAEEAKQRLEAIRRVRAAENAWVEEAQRKDRRQPTEIVEED